ncbi:MAG: histidine kinase [Saprospiraceae bacterium]|nr:histidine kinase [Saprospiraceae bacterium]
MIGIRIVLGILWLHLAIASCMAQVLQVDRWDGRSGLPSLSVLDVAQDRQGYLWVSLDHYGLVRFDGKSFDRPPAAIDLGSSIQHVVCLENGDLWSMGDKGVQCLTQEGEIREVEVTGVDIAAWNDSTIVVLTRNELFCVGQQGLTREIHHTDEDAFRKFVQTEGAIGILGDDWAYRVEGDHVDLIAPVGEGDNDWNDFVLLNGDSILAATSNGLRIGKLQGELRTHFSKCQALGSNARHVFRWQGAVWMVSQRLGLKSLACPPVTSRRMDEIRDVTVIHLDDWNNCWIGTKTRGLYRLKRTNSVELQVENGLSSATPRTLHCDPNGVWTIHENGAIDLLRRDAVRSSQAPPFGPNYVTSWIGDFSEATYFGSSTGLVMRSFSSDLVITQSNDDAIGAISDMLYASDSCIYMAGDRGLFRINLGIGAQEPHIERLIETSADHIREDSGELWICGAQLLAIRKDDDFVRIDLQGSTLTDIAINPSGQCYVSTVANGLFRVENNALVALPMVPEELYSIRAVCSDGDHLWMTSQDRLWELDCRSHDLQMMGSIEGDFMAGELVKSGRQLYAITNSGVFYYDLDQETKNIPGKIVVSDFRHPTPNSISATIQIIDPGTKETVLPIRWRVLGNGLDQWHALTESSIAMVNLGPGWYQLEVELLDGLGQRTISREHLAFEVKGKWYEKGAVRMAIPAAMLLLLLALMKLYHSFHQKRLKKEQALLKKQNAILRLEQQALRGQMDPHFIFNVLQSIQSKVVLQDTAAARAALQSFAGLMRAFLDQSRQVRWTLGQEIEALRQYLQVEQDIRHQSFAYSLDVPPGIELEGIYIPTMIVQPIVENAIKHGQPKVGVSGRIDVRFELKGKFLKCKVCDNGPGYQPKGAGGSAGLKVTRQRLVNYLHDDKRDPVRIEVRRDQNGTVLGTDVTILLPVYEQI